MTIHIVGAGLAGLAAACTLAERGHKIILHEAAKFAGGRARSYFDPTLDTRIDNGNHLLLSGNTATMHYLRRIGAENTLTGPKTPAFPFIDIAANKTWTLRPNPGRLPWWIFSPSRRVPHTTATDYLSLLKIRTAKPSDLIEPLLAHTGALYKNLLEPLSIAALNTMPAIASAAPLAAVIAETLQRGGAHAIPRFPKIGLSESFVDPAITYLRSKNAEIHFNDRITAIEPAQKTILAVPPWIAKELLPDLTAPDEFEAIANLHFRHELPPGEAGFWGLINATAEWAFVKGKILSVTISAANRHAETANDHLAATVWQDLAKAFNLAPAMPAYRLVREKRATFTATPAQLAKRPSTHTPNPNIKLAGDWTATNLPATIEGAIRSGNAAALAFLT